MTDLSQFPEIVYFTVNIRILHKHSEKLCVRLPAVRVADNELYSIRYRTRTQHIYRLWKTGVADKKFLCIVLHLVAGAVAVEHEKGLCCRGGFIKKGCVCYRHGGKVHHHSLEIQQRFESAL